MVEFLGYDPTPAPETLSERLKAKRRELGVTFSQVAQYFGWDEGTLTWYLDGTWRVPSARADALEALLVAPEADLIGIRCLPKRQR